MSQPAQARLASIRLRHLLSALLLLPLAATADWRQVERPPVGPGPAVTSFVTAADESLWTFSATTVRRTDKADNTRVVDHFDFADGLGQNGRRFPQADGGMILAGRPPESSTNECQLVRVDASLRSSPVLMLPSCSYAVGRDGTVWTASERRVSQLRSDGSVRVSLQPGGDEHERIVQIGSAADGGVLVLSARINMDSYLRRYDRDGRELWTWSSADPLEGFATTEDGAVYTYVRAGVMYRLDNGGQLEWRREWQQEDTPYDQIHSVATAGGALYLITARQAFNLVDFRTLMRFDADGTHWRETLCPGHPAGKISALFAAAADGQSAHVCSGNLLQRRDRQGRLTDEISLPLTQVLQLQYRDDGSLLLLGTTEQAPARLLALQRNGETRSGPSLEFEDYASLRLYAQLIDEQGSTYLLTQARDADTQPPVLKRIAADGTPVWSQTLGGGYLNEAQLSAAAGRICVSQRAAQQLLAACLDAGNGAVLWKREESISVGLGGFIKALADGSALLVQYSAPQQHQILLLSPSGELRRRIEGDGYAKNAAFGDNGDVAVITETTLALYNASGSRRYLVPEGPRRFGAPQLALAADGSVVLAEARDEGDTVWSYRPDGSLAWKTVLAGANASMTLQLRDGAVYVLEHFGDTLRPSPSRLSRLALADGTLRWQHDVPEPAFGQIAFLHSGEDILFAHGTTARLRLRRLDAVSGQLREERSYACGERCTLTPAFATDATRTARLVYRARHPAYGETAVAHAISHAATELPRTRLDQPGISGAWWAPYANGEGIALDWLAQQRTLFGAWFTYTTTGGNEPAQLRWYTIQANNVAANATSVQLPILETRGGNFDAGPPASPVAVGTATLSFSDCDNATLSYAFDAGHNDGVKGTITLSRLTPATEACILADGTTRPGAGAKPPQGGFDARMSGTWFEEATSGQGLQLTVQPGGVFFAPWFTYDPQGQGNDANREHWFTLQGNLATAADGKAEVVIAQSLGGAFDRIPTYNGYAVGKATVTMTACDKARIDYRFDDSEVAGSFRKRNGTLVLSRIGGCAAAAQ